MKFKPNGKTGGVEIELRPEERQLPLQAVTAEMEALSLFHINEILVPVDFSECSKKAVTYAVALAKQFDAKLTLLHILPPYPASSKRGYVGTDTAHEGRSQLEVLRLTIGDIAPVETMLRRGTAHKEIVKAAQELGSDVIIISTHGYRALTHALLGSTVEQVVRRAPCPVLVVREKEHEFLKIGEQSRAAVSR